MERRHIALILASVLLISTTSSHAGPFDSAFESLKKAFDQGTSDASESPRTEATDAAKARTPAGHDAKDVVDAFHGKGVDAHGYEGLLSSTDEYCAELIDPFQLTDMTTVLAEEAATSAAYTLANKMFGDTSVSTDPDDILASAKEKAKRMNWLPMPLEVEYGRSLHEERVIADVSMIARSNKGRIKRLYAQADGLLGKVLESISEDHPYDFKLFLIDNADLNAEALPGGYLYLSRGALESRYAELILSHEIAHVLKRHQTREIQARLVDSATTMKDLLEIVDDHRSPRAQVAHRVARLHGLVLNYSRQQELQADACSVRIVTGMRGISIENEIDPYVASITSAPISGNSERSLSLHPEYPQRAQRMKQAAVATRDGGTMQ